LYAFAPDNLAWLWAFFNWDTPVDLNQVESQDCFVPFEDPSGFFDQDHLSYITKYVADSPLFQYKYRGNLF
jgi:hypothetical protein